MWCNQFKFLVFDIIKRASLYRIKSNIFFLKLKRILTKSIFHMYVSNGVMPDSQSARPIHSIVSIWRKLWEDSISEWPLKQAGLVFAILRLSQALDGLFSVLSRLHGCKHKCFFCRMKHHWVWCDYFHILLLGILSSMEPTIHFQILIMLWWPLSRFW